MLLHRINSHLAVLARAIEATVGELLSVHLEAVPIRMEPPSAQAFHASLQDLLSRGQSPTVQPLHMHIVLPGLGTLALRHHPWPSHMVAI